MLDIQIEAPIELCFDLARDVETHARTSASTGERAVGGKTTGLLDLGDEVTWEAVHLGVRQRLTSRIVELDRPRRFVDEMVRGAFASFRHVHEFEEEDGAVRVRETFTWRSPLGWLGVLADELVVERHMRAFLGTKLAALKAIAETATRDRSERAGRDRAGRDRVEAP